MRVSYTYRHILEGNSSDPVVKWNFWGHKINKFTTVFIYLIGTLYLFVALTAVVC